VNVVNRFFAIPKRKLNTLKLWGSLHKPVPLIALEENQKNRYQRMIAILEFGR
jgi:hypothetical protein